MVAECQTVKSTRALLELVMSATSLVRLALAARHAWHAPARSAPALHAGVSSCRQLLLAYFTGYFFIEAAHTAGLFPSADGEEEEDVNPYIVLCFAALGILFDVLSLLSYKAWHLDSNQSGAPDGAKPNSKTNINKTNINMLSALLHVLSDFARVSVAARLTRPAAILCASMFRALLWRCQPVPLLTPPTCATRAASPHARLPDSHGRAVPSAVDDHVRGGLDHAPLPGSRQRSHRRLERTGRLHLDRVRHPGGHRQVGRETR